jgi:predicted O-methyltransferase YrrM
MSLETQAFPMPESQTMSAEPFSETALETWFKDKEFTTDWTSYHVANWAYVLQNFRGQVRRILELGSFEGRSAIAWLNLFPNATITCIDAFFSADTEVINEDTSRRFDNNLAPFGSRVEKIAEPFRTALPRLLKEGRDYDLIYNDGDHRRDECLAATVSTWPMLRQGGAYVWDDYLWEMGRPTHDRPQEAVDWFLDRYKSEFELLHKDYQVIVRRLSQS